MRETVREIEIPVYVPSEAPAAPASKSRLFDHVTDDALLGYGVPSEWLADARAATEDTLFGLAAHLPGEAAEALLELAVGGTPTPPIQVAEDTDPFEHPDAQRRFRLMENAEELERALDYPWEQWTVFLHPAQRAIVERGYGGPARVAGSAGTGKTVVALHRAVHLARTHPDARVLLTTFSDTLAAALRVKLGRLLGVPTHASASPCAPFDASASSSTRPHSAPRTSSTRPHCRSCSTRHRRPRRPQVQRALPRNRVERRGRRMATLDLGLLPRRRPAGPQDAPGREQRALLWSIFERVRSELAERDLVTLAGVFAAAAERAVDERRKAPTTSS